MTTRIGEGAVKRNASKQIEERKAERKAVQRKEFAMRYDRPKQVSFLDADSVNTDNFRAIPKDTITQGLSQAALAVYPVLCAQADFEKNNTFQVSQQNIAVWAGITDNTVRKGIRDLEAAGLLSREKFTEGTRHFYVYKVDFLRKPALDRKQHRGGAVYFYTCIVDNGIWASVSLGAKALYLILRAEGKQDLDLYNDIERVTAGEYRDYEPVEFEEYVRNRKWDVCNLSLAELGRTVGVGRLNVNAALGELERYGLTERVDKWTKVYLRPRRLLKY